MAYGFSQHDFDAASWFFITPTARTCRLGPRIFAIVKQCAVSIEARGNDPAVVEDEKVSRAEMLSNMREEIVAEIASRTVHHQHAARSALGGRLLRDQILGQIVVEIFDVIRTLTLWALRALIH
jgi:hypothetical protein